MSGGNTCPQRETQQGKRRTTVAERVACTYAQVVADAGAASEEQKAEEQPEVEEQKGCKNVNEPVYKSEYERNLAENWAKYEAEKRKRQEEYRKNEKSMQRRYKEGLQAKEKAQMEHWEKCEAERKSRQEKYRRDLSRQREAQSVVEQVQSPPKKSSRKQ
nr:vicilin-like seed storage protein At2g18540 [Aedes albopictus]